MQIDLKTVSLKPQRQTFSNVSDRIGGDKHASRYQEATLGLQPDANFHYRPTWDPDHELFDPARTKITMKDWYAFKDPRQYYYGNWTMTRARQQDAMESNFEFLEAHDIAGRIPDDVKKLVLTALLPLRHVAWGSNMNNMAICAYGYGTAFTAPSGFYAIDQLGIAQYITRLGLLLTDPAGLTEGKKAWLSAPEWQALRCYVEDTFVLTDWFELFVAQNLVRDGLLYPLIYDNLVDDYLFSKNAGSLAMATVFMSEWADEVQKWVDAQIKIASVESPENRARISVWTRIWRDRFVHSVKPLLHSLVPDEWSDRVIEQTLEQFGHRCAKAGLTL